MLWHREGKACRFHTKCNPSWLVSLLKCCFVAMASFSPTVPHLSFPLKAVWFCVFYLIFHSVFRMMYSGPVYVHLLHCVEVSDIFQIVPGHMEIPGVSQRAHSAPYKRLFVCGVLSLQPSLCVCPQPWKVLMRGLLSLCMCVWQFTHSLDFT